jgi:acetyl esterase/lipase
MQLTPSDTGPVALTGTPVDIPTDAQPMPCLFYAGGEARSPAIILCCGGMGTGMFEVMEWVGAGLAARGVNAVSISWRASSPVDDVRDISAAVDWLAAHDRVDPARIAVMGGSRGGNAALRAAALEPGLSAAITLGAATDFLQQVLGVAAYSPRRAELFRQWLGDPVADRAFYEEIQAITYAERISIPTLLIHGQHDMLCPPEQSIMMHDAMKRGGNDRVRLELMPFMGHYGDVVPNGYAFAHLTAMMADFLESAWPGGLAAR